ncbi:MAG: GNAT family N-acetyltransferase [Caldilineaceae bacterium]|nr:GNAT family N-acetyltransferase [Caldilineaceae bacterium]MCY4118587.1 GNAT family N-acetyltransferase [Caldilineaceae bacterium]
MSDQKQPVIAVGNAVDVELLREGFNRGFADYRYNMQMDPAAARAYMGYAGIAAEDCAVLIAEECGRTHGVGAALLAVRGEDGWCGGLSVAPEYRGNGWGRRLMEAQKRRGQERGLRRIRLEVRTENDPAGAVYRQVGFEPVRELLLWERDPRQGPLPLPFEPLEEGDPARVLQQFYGWHNLRLAWQRRKINLLNYVAQRNCVGLTIPARDGAPVAYAIAELMPRSRPQPPGHAEMRLQIIDIAVDPAAKLHDAARPLVQALQLRYVDALLTLYNEPADSRLNPIFASFGFRVYDRQYEMVLDL